MAFYLFLYWSFYLSKPPGVTVSELDGYIK